MDFSGAPMDSDVVVFFEDRKKIKKKQYGSNAFDVLKELGFFPARVAAPFFTYVC
ncbi:hypothetical protein HanIR_Chr09g0430911 [Helianthus annuus]|nr:hypothetical protein HanIR_Chr09g0430911 [Helianthus annuus]